MAILKYARDNRYDSSMACTHDLLVIFFIYLCLYLFMGFILFKFRNKMEAISAVKLANIINELKNYDVIGIDEGQFVIFLKL